MLKSPAGNGHADRTTPSAIILGGGDSVRLRSLTRGLAGDDRPQRFCPIPGRESFLAQTRRRSALLVPPEPTLPLLIRTHQRFYAPVGAGLPPAAAVIQPENRGTAPAILCALLRLAQAAGCLWNGDLGDPERVQAARARLRLRAA